MLEDSAGLGLVSRLCAPLLATPSSGRLHPLLFCCAAEMFISRSEVSLSLGIPNERLTFSISNLENSREKLGEAGSHPRRDKDF